MKDNPKTYPLLIGKGFPQYENINAKNITEEIPLLLKELNDSLDELERDILEILNQDKYISWENLMTPIYQIGEKLRWSWGAVCHLNSVCNSEEIRLAHAKLQPDVIKFINRTGQSKILYKGLSHLKEDNSLDKLQERIIKIELHSMHQKGIGLDVSKQEEFNRDSQRLAELSTKFSNNLLDATKDWNLLLKTHSQIDGLPPRALEVLAKAAKEAGYKNDEDNSDPTSEKGPWLLGLDPPRYIPFMTHANDRNLREVLYKASVRKASEGKFNNTDIIEEILTIRCRQAKRLGYVNWAELSLSSKMAKNIDNVEELLEDLRVAAISKSKEELKDLLDCAKRNLPLQTSNLAPWDINFWSEKLKQERFNVNQEYLRPWFPLPKVLDGLFKLCERLFEITIKPANGEAPTWHEDVQFFKIKDKDGSDIAAFYLDPYSRPKTKRGGAWMDECLGRNNHSEERKVLPVAYLICNQTPPINETPSLMSFEEVKTLFHEFGHGLQHMLTTVNYPQAAGINNVEWDAVELPSQFMENWCLDHQTLMSMAKHWQTNESLPEEEYKKLRDSSTFNGGLSTLRQLHFALTDLHLHSRWNKDCGLTPDELRRLVAENTTVIPPIQEDNFLCSFSHIFAGGYAAGYYSYKWAEVLSADAFSAFEEAGLHEEEKIKETGKLFRETILSMGGSQSPNDIFIAFRGRPPTTEALIRHSGLATSLE